MLLDEFGAGTDPAQGAALAQAVLDELLDKHTFVLAATHFPALKSYALTREGARAASMLFDPATKKPLFKLAYGQVGASQALDVAREHGLPETIVHRAEHYLLQDGQDATALLGGSTIWPPGARKNCSSCGRSRKKPAMPCSKAASAWKRNASACTRKCAARPPN